jgi:hypothetical protein
MSLQTGFASLSDTSEASGDSLGAQGHYSPLVTRTYPERAVNEVGCVE